MVVARNVDGISRPYPVARNRHDRGILVDDDLRSPDDPHVHAIGDCLAPRTVEEAVLEGLRVATAI